MKPVASTGVSRVTKRDMKLGKYQIPAGTLILCPFDAVHHNELNWEDADIFKPVVRHPRTSLFFRELARREWHAVHSCNAKTHHLDLERLQYLILLTICRSFWRQVCSLDSSSACSVEKLKRLYHSNSRKDHNTELCRRGGRCPTQNTCQVLEWTLRMVK